MFGMTSGADWLIAGLGNPEPKYDEIGRAHV